MYRGSEQPCSDQQNRRRCPGEAGPGIAPPHVRLIGSICTGAFVIAAAGLAEGRRLATHWAYCDRLQELYPDVEVERDAIFIYDDGLWSSAGISSGVDLALAMVEQDSGRELALMVARRLVVFERAGGQSQFSMPLEAQLADGPLAALARWGVENPAGDHRIEKLAQRANMTTRTFHRLFRETFGRAPGQWITSMRVECARRMLEESDRAVQEVASASGLGSSDTMRCVVEVGMGHVNARPPGDARQRGFGNLEIFPSLEVYRNPAHEFILTTGLSLTFDVPANSFEQNGRKPPE